MWLMQIMCSYTFYLSTNYVCWQRCCCYYCFHESNYHKDVYAKQMGNEYCCVQCYSRLQCLHVVMLVVAAGTQIVHFRLCWHNQIMTAFRLATSNLAQSKAAKSHLREVTLSRLVIFWRFCSTPLLHLRIRCDCVHYVHHESRTGNFEVALSQILQMMMDRPKVPQAFLTIAPNDDVQTHLPVLTLLLRLYLCVCVCDDAII